MAASRSCRLKDKGQFRFDKTVIKILFLYLNVLVKVLRQSFTFLCFPQTVRNLGRARGDVGGIMLSAAMTNIQEPGLQTPGPCTCSSCSHRSQTTHISAQCAKLLGVKYTGNVWGELWKSITICSFSRYLEIPLCISDLF